MDVLWRRMNEKAQQIRGLHHLDMNLESWILNLNLNAYLFDWECSNPQ